MNAHFLLEGLHKVVEECVASSGAGLCVYDLVKTGDLESVGISSVPFVHVVSKGQHNLQHLLQFLAGNHLSAGTQDCFNLWSHLHHSI